MLVIRRVGALVLAVAAVLVWFLMEPDVPRTPEAEVQRAVASRSTDISQAMSEYELNNTLAGSAPQQQVVNGWVAKDLLQIIAEQQDAAVTRPQVAAPVTPVVPPDERVPALVGLVVLGVALFLGTTTRVTPDRTGASAGAPEPPALGQSEA